MDKSRIDQLNRILGSACGLTPHGAPSVKWVHARDLTYRFMEKGRIVDFPQLTEAQAGDGPSNNCSANRWVIARWVPPQMTLTQHRIAFGDTFPYDRRGEYICTDIRLHRGVEPTDAVTDAVIGQYKDAMALSASGYKDRVDDSFAASGRDNKRTSTDMLHDKLPAFGHVPGAKDNVSIGGF